MKPFDENFADNVREAFDNYHEPVDEQAWATMKNRLQAGSKRRMALLFPLWAKAAAVVLLLSSVGLLTLRQWQMQPQKESLQVLAEKEVHDSSPVLAPEANGNEPPMMAEEHRDANALLATQSQTDKEPDVPSHTHTPSLAHASYDKSEQLAEPDAGEVVLYTDELAHEALRKQPETEPGDERTMLPADLAAEHQKPETAAVKMPFNGQEGFAALDYPLAVQESETSYRLGAGPMKTFLPGEISQGMGFSAGLTGHWSLAGNFSISTGGAIVYNQFRFDDIAFAGGRGDYYADATLPNLGVAQGVEVLHQKQFTDFEFYAIDIPVNFSYRIREAAGSQMFVSAGISTFIYLQQHYSSYSEVLAEMTFDGYRQTNFASLSREGEFSPFDRFDFARFLNFSAGYVLKREEYQIIIEPFVKMPVGGVTSFNLDMGMAGLTLKYGFYR